MEATEEATEDAEDPEDPVLRLLIVMPLEVSAVISTLVLLFDIRKSWTLESNLHTSDVEDEESVEDTEPMGDRRDDVSSNEVEEWVSPPLELWGLPFPVESRSMPASHLW